MSQQSITTAPTVVEPHSAARWPLRLKVLLALHLVVGMAPAAMYLVLVDLRYLPLMWALGSVGLAQLMLLMLWVGMGRAGPLGRLAGSLAGSLYLAIWPIVGLLLVDARDDLFAPPALYVIFAAAYWAAVLVLGGAFLLVCRVAGVKFDGALPAQLTEESSQYSLRQLLVLVTLAAIVLAAMRPSHSRTQQFGEIVEQLSIVVDLFVLAAGAAWATLSPGRPWWRVGVLMLVAVGLGIVEGSALLPAPGPGPWWHASAAHLMILVLPTMIVAATLLVVRSCGYRLMRKQSVGDALPA